MKRFEGQVVVVAGAGSGIGAAVPFLLSDEAEWILGQVLSVDGGATMR